jgi:DTW domain-containing protein YfiP
MNEPLKNRRVTCPRCLRPQRTCICHWVTPTGHSAEVVILQHPLEAGNAKGSARLLQMSLSGSQLVIGEAFAEQELQALLYAPFRREQTHRMQPVLLYPELPQEHATHASGHAAFDKAIFPDPARIRLIVLDGTWRKSRKMLYLNPLLQRLPRLPLSNMPASQYTIRKAHGADQLSTLEAACYALMQLEGSDAKYQPLLAAFKGFVAQQAGYASRADPAE